MKPSFRSIATKAVSKGRLKYVADVLKSLAVLVVGVSLVTPSITGRPISGSLLFWEAVALFLVFLGLIITPET